jgi:hypothetical protein
MGGTAMNGGATRAMRKISLSAVEDEQGVFQSELDGTP